MRNERKQAIRKARLTELVKDNGGKNSVVGRKMGYKDGSFIYQMLNKRAITEDTAREFETVFKKPYMWMDDESSNSDDSKSAINNTSEAPETKGLVPLISFVQAGEWHEAEDPFPPGEADEFRPCPISHGMYTYALRVDGDSMTAPYGKSYPHGCIIYVDPEQTVENGDSVIAKINGDNKVTFKQFVEEGSKRYLRPLNPNLLPIEDEFRVIGKVIGTWIGE